jgi:phage gp29-like protein
MRLLSLIFLCCIATTARAADAAKLPDWQPVPPPPALEANGQDSDLEPQITIVQKSDMVIEEYRSGGILYLVKVTPKIGPPYYLVDESGNGNFIRRDGPGGSNLSPPRWIIHRF